MSLFCFASAHGAPGVTTTTAVAAGVWPAERRRILVEADPFGGMVAARFGVADTPGLVSLAAQARRRLDTEMVSSHTQELPGGVPVLVAPATADQAQAVVSDIAARLANWATTAEDVDVIVDCGRLTLAAPHVEFLHRADRVLVLVRPTVDQLRPVSACLSVLTSAGIRTELVLVGDRPYGSREVESALGVRVAGVVALDPPTATVLAGEGSASKLGRSSLVRSVASLATDLLVPATNDMSVGVGT